MHRPFDYDPECGCEGCRAVEAAEVQAHAWMAGVAAPQMSPEEIRSVYEHKPGKAETLLRLTEG